MAVSKHPQAWKHPQAVPLLVPIVRSVAKQIWIIGTGINYDSLDMNSGINVAQLCEEPNLALIRGAMQQDPRGGYIRQADAYDAMALVADEPEFKANVEALWRTAGLDSLEKFLTQQAYTWRILCRHTRIKKKHQVIGRHQHWLRLRIPRSPLAPSCPVGHLCDDS